MFRQRVLILSSIFFLVLGFGMGQFFGTSRALARDNDGDGFVDSIDDDDDQDGILDMEDINQFDHDDDGIEDAKDKDDDQDGIEDDEDESTFDEDNDGIEDEDDSVDDEIDKGSGDTDKNDNSDGLDD